MDSLSSILDTLKVWFGRSLVLSGIVPVALLATLNLVMIRLLYPGAWRTLRETYDAEGTPLILLWLGTVLVLIAISFLLLSLNGVIRRAMEGTVLGLTLPGWFHVRQRKRHYRSVKEEENVRRALFAFRGMAGWKPTLKAARLEGVGKSFTSPSANEFEPLQKNIDELESKLGSRETINRSTVEPIFQSLESKLQNFSVEKFDELEQLHVRFGKLLDSTVEQTETRWQTLVNERQQSFPLRAADVEATAMANIRKAHRDHLIRTYGIDIEVFWIALLKFALKDEQLGPILDEAKAQLDFSVAMTAVLTLFTLPWTVLAALHPGSSLAYILVGLGGGLLVSLAYQASLQNFRAFNESVKSVVDLHRFELLHDLHLQLPATPAEEQAWWRWLADHDGEPPFKYTHS